MAKIEAVIFDMDGVLIDAQDWHFESLNRALALFGYSISRFDHLVTYDGLPTKKKLEMLSRERGLPPQLHDFVNHLKQDYTLEMIYTRCKPAFYHEYALARLHAEGFGLAVASNSIRATVELMMDRAALRPYFQVLLSNQDVTRAKPDPEIYTLAIQRLGKNPNQCLIVEDNQNGIKAAQAAGAHVMVVGGITDVTYQNIAANIARAQRSAA
ncbi:MAG TPA: HAD family phosphatase [Phycisphaerae bacterium]|jgi:HAD superfamily hydrolase (TIGR01509 family)